MTLPSKIAACVWLVLALLSAPAGCQEYSDPADERTTGGPGFPCFFDQDCSAPLFCGETQGARFEVCTGGQSEGDACNGALACAWIRDERGLPLECIAGKCAFPRAPALE